MATGPFHYTEAERLLDEAAQVMNAEWGIYSSMGSQERLQRRAALTAEAQVHATLALAAATALNRHDPGMRGPESDAWHAVAGTKPGRAS